jgi:hypothetical protein
MVRNSNNKLKMTPRACWRMYKVKNTENEQIMFCYCQIRLTQNQH